MEITKFLNDSSEDSCLGKSLGKKSDYFKRISKLERSCFQDWTETVETQQTQPEQSSGHETLSVEDLDQLSIKYKPEEKAIIQRSNNSESISKTDNNIKEEPENINFCRIPSFWKCSILVMVLTGIHFILLYIGNFGGHNSIIIFNQDSRRDFL